MTKQKIEQIKESLYHDYSWNSKKIDELDLLINDVIEATEQSINYSQCCTQLPNGMMQIDNAYVEDSDEVDGYYVDGRYTKVFVLQKDFENNKCIKN
jgi:hypothetical protein